MENYKKLLKLGCFTFSEASAVFENVNTTKTVIRNLKAHGLVESVKRNLYVAVSMETDSPVVSAYEIASHITPTSYISHHSAFEYYGMANQVYEDIYVSSEEKFNPFEFDGHTFRYISSKISNGIVADKQVRVTDIERTIVDNIKDFNKIGGFEELIHCFSMITYADENKLISYLNEYDNQFLYQKTGYILSNFQRELKLSNELFKVCSSKINRSIRYIYPDIVYENPVFNQEWQLYVPADISSIIDDGGNIDV